MTAPPAMAPTSRLLITVPSVRQSTREPESKAGAGDFSGGPGGEGRRPGPERQQAHVAPPPHGRALFQRVVAPAREEQARGGQGRRRVDGVERLQQVLDEPEPLGTRLQAVRSGETSK